jgi:hypothetical protein
MILIQLKTVSAMLLEVPYISSEKSIDRYFLVLENFVLRVWGTVLGVEIVCHFGVHEVWSHVVEGL